MKTFKQYVTKKYPDVIIIEYSYDTYQDYDVFFHTTKDEYTLSYAFLTLLPSPGKWFKHGDTNTIKYDSIMLSNNDPNINILKMTKKKFEGWFVIENI